MIMFKGKAKFIVLLLAISALGIAAFTFLIPWFISGNMKATFKLITQEEFHCPVGTTDAIERWGKAGYMRFCQKGDLKHGPWMGWENQYKNIQGEYREGKEHGLWVVWSKDGSQFKTIEYRDGAEIRQQTRGN